METKIREFLDDRKISYALIKPATIIFRPEYRKKCIANHCGRYNRSWSCPPAIGDPELIIAAIWKYSRGIMIQAISPLEDPYDLESMDQGRKQIQDLTQALNENLRQTGQAFALFDAGSCTICPVCTYPTEPCRFPERMLIAMESLGIDVADLAKNAGMRYYNGPSTITYFALVLFGADHV